MIDIRKLKELVKLMVQNDLTEMDLRDSEEQVTIQRPNHWSTPQMSAGGGVAVAAPPGTPAVTPDPPTQATAADDRTGLVAIESPMVGTYYSASSPDADEFVTVGGAISDGSVVCLL